MTPQEQQLLTSLTQRINQTQLQEKDQDAENLLGRELGANPDAMYILAQTVLVQNIALDQARAQVNQLQQQAQQARQQPAHATSFLGRLLGDHDPAPQQPQPPPYQPVPAQYAPPPPAQPQYAAPPYPQAQYVPAGQPSFMRGAMQTAAGVAAGALAFEGVESILHGFGHGGYGPGMGMSGFGMAPGMGMGGGFERPVEENVVNNYYDSPGGQSGSEPHFHESSDTSGGTTGNDFSGSGAQFNDASYNTSGNDQGGYDDSRTDDASSAYDNSVDNVQIDDGGQDDSGQDTGGDVGFDDGGGGFGGDDGSSVL